MKKTDLIITYLSITLIITIFIGFCEICIFTICNSYINKILSVIVTLILLMFFNYELLDNLIYDYSHSKEN